MAQYKIKSTRYTIAGNGGATGDHYLGAWIPAGAIMRNVVVKKATALAGGFKAAIYAGTGICLATGITYNGTSLWATGCTGIKLTNVQSINTVARQLRIRTNGTHTAGAYDIHVEYIK